MNCRPSPFGQFPIHDQPDLTGDQAVVEVKRLTSEDFRRLQAELDRIPPQPSSKLTRFWSVSIAFPTLKDFDQGRKATDPVSVRPPDEWSLP